MSSRRPSTGHPTDKDKQTEQKQKPVSVENPDNGEIFEDLVAYAMMRHDMTREEAEAEILGKRKRVRQKNDRGDGIR